MRRWLLGLALLAAAGVLPAAGQSPAQMTDDQVRLAIIQQSVAAYSATGRPCACPYQLDRAGRSCGGRSAYSRPGGASPLCYPADVTPGMMQDWRRTH